MNVNQCFLDTFRKIYPDDSLSNEAEEAKVPSLSSWTIDYTDSSRYTCTTNINELAREHPLKNGSFRILVLGERETGKTSLTTRFITGDLSEVLPPRHSSEVLTHGDLQIWDMFLNDDQEKCILKAYVEGAFGAVIVADATRQASFDRAIEMKRFIDAELRLRVPVVLALNKSDLVKKGRQLKQSFLDWAVKEHGFLAALTVSAKSGLNVQECFNKVVDDIKSNKIEPPNKLQLAASLLETKILALARGLEDLSEPEDILKLAEALDKLKSTRDHLLLNP